jgi:predicted outer membrane repeat protein
LDGELGGGAVFSYGSDPTLINTTLESNSAVNNGGAFYCIGSDPILINTIMWDNSPQELFLHEWSTYPNTITTSYCDISGGEEGVIFSVYDTVYWLEGNIDEDPIFAGTGEHPYTLSNESPCVNAGTPDTTGLNLPELDLAGNPRIYGGRIEMGAYENQEVAVSVNENVWTGHNTEMKVLPNPVKTTAGIEYEVSEPSWVHIDIITLNGQPVETLINAWQDKGIKKVWWDAAHLPAGTYLCRLQVGKEEVTGKVVKLP